MIVHSHEMKARAAFFAEEEILRGPLPPSERDLEIYEAVVIEGETTRSAANAFELSQTRIVQICERVAEWVAGTLPETPRLSRRARLRLASHVAEGRLDHLYSLAMQAFDKSLGEQTTVRVSDRGETTTTRTSCGDIKYLSLASRLAERKYAVVLRGLQGARGLEREGEDGREGEAPAEPRSQGSGFGVQEGEDGGQKTENRRQTTEVRSRLADVPPVGDCSRFGDARLVATDAGVMSNAATADESAVYDEIERRRRAFLAALDNDTSPVQPPRVDAGGMLLEEAEGEQETEDREQTTEGEELALAGVLPMAALTDTSTDACPTARPLSRRERRARQRMLEKKLRLRKAR